MIRSFFQTSELIQKNDKLYVVEIVEWSKKMKINQFVISFFQVDDLHMKELWISFNQKSTWTILILMKSDGRGGN